MFVRKRLEPFGKGCSDTRLLYQDRVELVVQPGRQPQHAAHLAHDRHRVVHSPAARLEVAMKQGKHRPQDCRGFRLDDEGPQRVAECAQVGG